MAMTIWKYDVGTEHRSSSIFSLEMPEGARVLTMQMQSGSPQLWVLVDPKAERELRQFVTYGTGRPIPSAEDLTYISTVQGYNSSFVFHLFEI